MIFAMIDPSIRHLVRPHIPGLKPYSSARDDFDGNAAIFLDANENPFGEWNRYPDPHQRKLRAALAGLYQANIDCIAIGNGSDELIDLLIRLFCRPGRDRIMILSPTYGMYAVTATFNDVGVVDVPLADDFALPANLPDIVRSTENLKMLFVCSPNNPTGNVMDRGVLEEVMDTFPGIVVIDEAYADFSSSPSWIRKLDACPRLVVLRTLSKAWGLAGARIGIALASPAITVLLDSVKPPYNVSGPDQAIALAALVDATTYVQRRSVLLEQRDRLDAALRENPAVLQVFPSEANFLLVRVRDADGLYHRLLAAGIVVRNRDHEIPGALRISVGTPEENETLLNILDHEARIVY
jgi:histidinol-phosphate aminotransferase